MKIPQHVLEILGRGSAEAALYKLPPGQLDRKTYTDVNKVLEAAGGKWNRKLAGHLFDCDAEEALDSLLNSGEVVDRKKEFGFFETPPWLAQRMVEEAGIQPGELVLEPSAGRGNIVEAAVAAGAGVACVEILPQNTAVLAEKFLRPKVTILEDDFLNTEPTTDYTAVLMNPPFSKRADVKHVLHAMKFLRPGGRLVAIMSAGVKYREDNLTRTLRGCFTSCEALPENTFKEAGTCVNTVLVRIV